MQGRSFVPVVTSREGAKSWHNEAYIRFAASAIGRALRTERWTYATLIRIETVWRLRAARTTRSTPTESGNDVNRLSDVGAPQL